MYLNTYLVYIQKQLRTIKITFNILPYLEMKMIIWKILLMSYITACHSKITTPIVFWHGMGGNNSSSVSYVKKRLPDAYIHSLRIGNSQTEDIFNGFFMDPTDQIKMACDMIRKDPMLKNGYNAIGWSQGGLFMRGIAQKCPQKMKNLITFGTPHQGISGFPDYLCGWNVVYIYFYNLCTYAKKLFNYFAYKDLIQNTVVQAQFWHNPFNDDLYTKKSKFLADINNDREIPNQAHKSNLLNLKNFVMVKFDQDMTVIPRESQWFGFYELGQDEKLLGFNQTKLYLEDWIGLKTLDEHGKLDFLLAKGGHLDMNDNDELFDKIVEFYLSD